MPVKKSYLVRREADGTQRTIVAQSERGAMVLFVVGYHPPAGEDFRVKERGDGGWTWYRVLGGGRFRKLPGA